tara:strand:- start:189 stop:401 length:213 start_codon:yes stop_codon:yes gene_type:complete
MVGKVMIIAKRSMLTGIINSMDIAVSEEQLQAWESGELIQEVMPDLTADEREFIMTGTTANDWKEIVHNE